MQITPRCRMAIERARKAQIEWAHAYLSTWHLVFGLFSVDCGAARVLRKAGLTINNIRFRLMKPGHSAEKTIQRGDSVVGQSASDAMQRAEVLARDGGCRYVGTEHLLLALLEEDGGDALEIFIAGDIDRAKMRQSLNESLHVEIYWPDFEN